MIDKLAQLMPIGLLGDVIKVSLKVKQIILVIWGRS